MDGKAIGEDLHGDCKSAWSANRLSYAMRALPMSKERSMENALRTVWRLPRPLVQPLIRVLVHEHSQALRKIEFSLRFNTFQTGDLFLGLAVNQMGDPRCAGPNLASPIIDCLDLCPGRIAHVAIEPFGHTLFELTDCGNIQLEGTVENAIIYMDVTSFGMSSLLAGIRWKDYIFSMR